MLQPRLLFAAPVLLVLLAGCGGSDPVPNDLAAAECGLPVSQRFQLTQDQRVVRTSVTVQELSGGRSEVTGTALIDPRDGIEDRSRARQFRCVIAPDAADKLRGLRLETLDMPDTLGAWSTSSPEVVVRSYVDALSVGDLELARSLSTSEHVRRVEGQTDSWYRNVVYISELELGAIRREGDDRFVPVTFTLQQRRAQSMPNGDTTWGYKLRKTAGRWLIADEGPI